MSISYIDNRVNNDTVVILRMEYEEGPDEGRKQRWEEFHDFAWLYRWQQQRLHLRYLDAEGKSFCTCGLTLIKDDELHPIHYPAIDLDLDPFLMIAGHRNLPDCDGETIALVVHSIFSLEIKDFLWTAFCQSCEEVIQQSTAPSAIEFVDFHNNSCKQ